MGGFTSIQLQDTSQEHIDEQNAELDALGVAKRYRFYSEKNIRKEWEHYQNDGPAARKKYYSQFPQDITSYETFKLWWSPKRWGTCFIPEVGMLTLTVISVEPARELCTGSPGSCSTHWTVK